MDVEFVSRTAPNEKATVLAEAPGVTRLVKVSCHKDPAWSLELLQRAAPTVERLSVGHPQEAHLLAVHAMPRLRRLHVMMGADADLDAPPVVLPALPPGHAGLQCLTVSRLPRATTQSLLLAHGRALEELQLWVGTAGSLAWPRSCGDLHSLLEQCGLRALRRLVLVRAHKFSHETAACGEQLAEVRRLLPSAEVLCDVCDSVEVDEV
ncbi:uncharacterized protein LOC113210197 [Frankliniella occidentalis]|uniref:Uncharacterized protein LOC113210197 n=1 Tax=Frankliniella occidentalis TaxID=133901 RepID=A0A6J1SRD7_FRAOC|nr:uncharacterized protein LOC113210197 [Frankliniella occidentalis]